MALSLAIGLSSSTTPSSSGRTRPPPRGRQDHFKAAREGTGEIAARPCSPPLLHHGRSSSPWPSEGIISASSSSFGIHGHCEAGLPFRVLHAAIPCSSRWVDPDIDRRATRARGGEDSRRLQQLVRPDGRPVQTIGGLGAGSPQDHFLMAAAASWPGWRSSSPLQSEFMSPFDRASSWCASKTAPDASIREGGPHGGRARRRFGVFRSAPDLRRHRRR